MRLRAGRLVGVGWRLHIVSCGWGGLLSFRHFRCQSLREALDWLKVAAYDSNSKHAARVMKNYLQRQEEQRGLQQKAWPTVRQPVWDYTADRRRRRTGRVSEQPTF